MGNRFTSRAADADNLCSTAPGGARVIPTRASVRRRRLSLEDQLDGFDVKDGRAIYRPAGSVTFGDAVALVRDAIARARAKRVNELLVDTTALTGFSSPSTFD